MIPLLLTLSCTGSTPVTDSTPAVDSPTDSTADDSAVGTDDSDPPPLPTLVVNELLADNDGSWTGPGGEVEDWLELHNVGDDFVDLGGLFMSDDWTDKDRSPLPEGLLIEPGGHQVFILDGLPELGPEHLDFRLNSDGERVGLFTADERTVDWVVYAELEADTAWARIPDGSETWEAVVVGTPGAANARLRYEEQQLVSLGALWRYWDRARYPEDTWTGAGFDDSGWSEGPAPLGYGDSHIVTTILYGSDASNKRTTAWFRHSFTVDNPNGISDASFELMADDGAVATLNGVELGRLRMADGEVTPTTFANATASGASETTAIVFEVDPALFIEGENLLAIEVHQVNPSSSDMGMDASLTARSLVRED